MRKITAAPIVIFFTCFGLSIVLGIATAVWLLDLLPLGDFRGVTIVFGAVFFIYCYALVLYRIFLKFMPLPIGSIEAGSRDELIYHVYVLFYLMLFYPLTRNFFIPTPLMRLIYQILGAKLGENTYSAGVILDPPLTEVGANTIIGHDAVLFSHAIEGAHLSHAKIVIGDNVTVGAKAIIMSGVAIGDDAIVAAGAVVRKDTQIGAGELWGGNPARKIR